jgi:hypothetical protein
MKTILRIIERAITIYHEVGLRRLSYRIWTRVHQSRQASLWLQQKTTIDDEFDAAWQTNTGGVDHLFRLRINGENARFGISHIASDPYEFSRMMDQLEIEFANFTFVDLGSGKGRAVILAAQYPFRRIIGVEFALELHEAAKENIASAKMNSNLKPAIELICNDVATYELPDEPLLLYLFHPFGQTLVRRVPERAIASWRKAPRPISILYMNPVHLSEFIDSGWRVSHSDVSYAQLLPNAEDPVAKQ